MVFYASRKRPISYRRGTLLLCGNVGSLTSTLCCFSITILQKTKPSSQCRPFRVATVTAAMCCPCTAEREGRRRRSGWYGERRTTFYSGAHRRTTFCTGAANVPPRMRDCSARAYSTYAWASTVKLILTKAIV